jgi:hypothetical protein
VKVYCHCPLFANREEEMKDMKEQMEKKARRITRNRSQPLHILSRKPLEL